MCMDGKLFDSYLESKTNKTNTRFQYQAKKHYMTMQSVYNLHLCIKKVGYYENIAFKNVPIELRIH